MSTTLCLLDDTDDDPNDLFEIEDYYIASDLEGLVVIFENLFKQWKPLIEEKIERRTIISREQISVQVEIVISGFSETDADQPISLLNLPIYINLVPQVTASVGSEARFVLSAACMAAVSTGLNIPLIVASDESLWIGRSLSCRYEVQVMDWNFPERLTNLSGILSVFYELNDGVPPILPPMITVEHVYGSHQFDSGAIINRNRHLDEDHSEFVLRWGCSSKQMLLMRLLTRWTPFPEGVFTSNSFFTELDPRFAPIWLLSCQLPPDARFHLSFTLRRFLSSCKALAETATLEEIARRDRHLIPPYDIQNQANSCFRNHESMLHCARGCTPTKSCPFGSLLSSLVLLMMQQSFHEPYRIVQLYYAFLGELRRYWDEGLPLPGMLNDKGTPIPNLHCCLLYQKLQVLNHCIILRNTAAGDAARQVSLDVHRANHYTDFDNDDSNDDFKAEATEPISVAPDDSKEETTESDSVARSVSTSSEALPEGVKVCLSDVNLLNGKAKMNVPITLESPLLTEDEIEEQHEILAGLGTDRESTAVRAEMQSASLSSDMSAFKAANPGAELGDFVRWYSPNDWVEGKGLSKRMSGSNNFWKKCWIRATPCPASRQPPLFDFVAHGERILDYCRTIPPNVLFEQISAIAISNASSFIAKMCSAYEILPSLSNAVDMMFQKVDHAVILDRIEDVERAAVLASRLFGGTLTTSEIDDIISKGLTSLEFNRERFVPLFEDKFRSMSSPDQSLYTVSSQDSCDSLSVTVQLDGCSLVTAHSKCTPQQIIFCSALPI